MIDDVHGVACVSILWEGGDKVMGVRKICVVLWEVWMCCVGLYVCG